MNVYNAIVEAPQANTHSPPPVAPAAAIAAAAGPVVLSGMPSPSYATCGSRATWLATCCLLRGPGWWL